MIVISKVKSLFNNLVMRYRITKLNFCNKAKISIEKSVRLDWNSNVYAYNGAHISIDNNVYLRSNPKGYHSGMPFPTTLLADCGGASINIGANTRLNGVYVHAQSSISIGSNCVIAAGVNIMDSNGHQVVSSNRTIGRDNPKPIIIGNNVWIGVNAQILKGVTICDNCVVSAGSVVGRGEYPRNSLIQGNPATVVGSLQIDK